MAATLEDVSNRLHQIAEVIPQHITFDKPIGIQNNNWSMPAVDKSDLIEEALSINALIDAHEDTVRSEGIDGLETIVERLDFLINDTVPQLASQAQSIPVYSLTLQSVRKHLMRVLNQPDTTEISRQISQQRTRVRSLTSRLNDIEPRTEKLNEMLSRIENASEAAEQLPTDLESLSEARIRIFNLEEAAKKEAGNLHSLADTADKQKAKIDNISENAEAILKRCETAYASATSVGLAAAFFSRSLSLNKSIAPWVIGLIVALVAGGYYGSKHLQNVSVLIEHTNAPMSVIILNLLLALFSVGAPVWFAWLATKQIGQRFRLSEDYAFKASISQAYEGYRREAARIDPAMEAQLLSSALTRLDELPLRLVEVQSHGSPWGELAHSEVVKEAMKTVPYFVEAVKALASQAVSGRREQPGDKEGVVSKKPQSPNDEEG